MPRATTDHPQTFYVFHKPWCPYCKNALKALSKHHVQDRDLTSPSHDQTLLKWMAKDPKAPNPKGSFTVPQIWRVLPGHTIKNDQYDGKALEYIGGSDKLLMRLRQGFKK